MKGLQRLQAAGKNAGQRFGFHGLHSAYLGKGDGTGTVVQRGAITPGTVWCYGLNAGVREQFPAVLWPMCGIPYQDNPDFELNPLAVTVGYFAESPILWVFGALTQEALQNNGGATIIQQMIQAAGTPVSANILDFRITPDDPASKRVYVEAGWYWTSAGDLKYFGRDYVDLTSAIAALSSGQHAMAAICMDTSAVVDQLVAVVSTAVTGTAKNDFTAVTLDAIEIPSIYLPCGAAHLYYNQASVTEADIYREVDPRVIFSTPAANTLDSILSDGNGDLLTDGNGDVIYA